jgi:hypothetical protein
MDSTILYALIGLGVLTSLALLIGGIVIVVAWATGRKPANPLAPSNPMDALYHTAIQGREALDRAIVAKTAIEYVNTRATAGVRRELREEIATAREMEPLLANLGPSNAGGGFGGHWVFQPPTPPAPATTPAPAPAPNP